MRIASGVAVAILPTIISEIGQGIRAWLDHRRKKTLQERVDDIEKRVAALEAKP